MISRQELQYVASNAQGVPYPGDDYAYDVINRLSRAMVIFKQKYDGKKYSLILSNGEEIIFEIKSKNLAHLLGIDFKGISTNTSLRPLLSKVLEINDPTQVNSYNVLSKIVENGDKVIANDESSIHKLLNYYKIMIKTSCFDTLAEFNEFNFGIINFDKDIYEKTNTLGSRFYPASTKFIFTQNDEALMPYCMMGLTYDNGTDLMIPETFIAPTNFCDYVYNQELLLPVQLLVNDEANLTKLVATPEEKIRILNLYKSIIETYNTGSYINIFNDYETILRDNVASKKKIK